MASSSEAEQDASVAVISSAAEGKEPTLSESVEGGDVDQIAAGDQSEYFVLFCISLYPKMIVPWNEGQNTS